MSGCIKATSTYYYRGVVSEIILNSENKTILSESNYYSLLSYLNDSRVILSNYDEKGIGFKDELFNTNGTVIGWIELLRNTISINSKFKRHVSLEFKTNTSYLNKTEDEYELDRMVLEEYNDKIVTSLKKVYHVDVISSSYQRFDKIVIADG